MQEKQKKQETISLSPVNDASAWRAADLRADTSWIYRLTAENIGDIDAALNSVTQRGLEFPQVQQQDFPLPTMQPLFRQLREQVLRGRGFALLKGLPVERYSDDEADMIFWGLGTYLGIAVTQNAAGELISRVYDRGMDVRERTVRGYQVRAELQMHCDNADLFALLCLRRAKSGGKSLLTSSMSVYNEILRNHPEYLGLLFSGFVYDHKNEEGPGESPVSPKIPVFSFCDGVLSCRFSRTYIINSPHSTGIALSAIDYQVLDYIHAVSLREDLLFEFTMDPGDLQIGNNYTVFHGRNEYEDYPEPERKRALLRLWLEVPDVRPMCNEAMRYGNIRFGNLGKSAAEWLAQQDRPRQVEAAK